MFLAESNFKLLLGSITTPPLPRACPTAHWSPDYSSSPRELGQGLGSTKPEYPRSTFPDQNSLNTKAWTRTPLSPSITFIIAFLPLTPPHHAPTTSGRRSRALQPSRWQTTPSLIWHLAARFPSPISRGHFGISRNGVLGSRQGRSSRPMVTLTLVRISREQSIASSWPWPVPRMGGVSASPHSHPVDLVAASRTIYLS